MYLEHFGLTEFPFQLTPDPEFLYLSDVHRRARAYMGFAILQGDGLVVVTGDIGSGKTLLIHSLLRELDDEVEIAHLFQTQLDEFELLRSILTEFGIESIEGTKAELLRAINQYLITAYKEKRRVVLVVDEAQNLSVKALEELRLLSGLETEKEKLLTIVLVGQRELDDLLDSPRLEQLAQRVRLRYTLGHLPKEEIGNYIHHRLEIAGATRPIFADGLTPFIHVFTGGVPRLINILCDTALVTAFVDKRESVDEQVMKDTVKELHWVPYEARFKIDSGEEPRSSSGQRMQTGGRVLIEVNGEVVSDIRLSKQSFTIGRHEDSDIRLANRSVSRHHAQLSMIGEKVFLMDLGSRNGTCVNGQRIRVSQLKDGDAIEVGSYKLRYTGDREHRAADEADEPGLRLAPDTAIDSVSDANDDLNASLEQTHSIVVRPT
jgi:type II secretory pathway predicted ATPase ExeA